MGEQLPLARLINILDEQTKIMIKKNILQNYISISKLNFNYINMWRLFQKKQIYFQCLYTLLDICFYYELTLLLGQNYQQSLS